MRRQVRRFTSQLMRAAEAGADAVRVVLERGPGSYRSRYLGARLSSIGRRAAAQGYVIGASVLEVDGGRKASWQGEVAMPLASTAKVAIAVALLRLRAQGEVSDEAIVIEPRHVCQGGPLAKRPMSWLAEKGRFSVASLLEPMLVKSDNTAADVALELAGGPASVTAMLGEIGIGDMRIDRSMREVLCAFIGAAGSGPEIAHDEPLTPGRWDELMRGLHPEQALAGWQALWADPRDRGTPEAMNHLLAAIARAEVLSAPDSAMLLAFMAASTTGAGRLGGLLPPAARVAHKSGTLGPVVQADVGIVESQAAGRLAVSVFIGRPGHATAPAAPGIIAEIARAFHQGMKRER